MDEIVLIGIDGGASKVLVHKVDILINPMRFVALKPFIEVAYSTSESYNPKFKPIVLSRQLKEHNSGSVVQTKSEAAQETALLESFTKAIRTILGDNVTQDVIVGIGLPGLKTKNGRGISAMANGPRMPKFLNKLEKNLKKEGYTTLNPIQIIGSDADYCGLGEQWGDAGGMRGVNSAYYFGVGTGIADAMLLNGKNVPFDACKSWIAKTWEMMANEEESYENLLSAKGIQARYAGLTETTVEELDKAEIFPWQIYERALIGEEAAIEIVGNTAQALSELLFHRIQTLALGAPETFLRDAKRTLEVEHEYIGGVFERIVIGQRLGNIWEFKKFTPLLLDPVNEKLGRMIHSSSLPAEVKSQYLTKTNRLRDDLIIHSELRHAPALGAAVDAYLEWIEQ
ncbi:MAG: ROK family protein [Candidatus Marinimicrobia bacterium]|nr:ROK family protein [Candidatus Neomarinimicrobiota bacterium]MBT4362597.1 ROK family protein [Candidatus Neomarinimicrobiota bacterium]MBT4713189.1 ROK family protein [Candidatus Neomarinimicrobiota bacterium]MBT4947585.1 ROK family protein [Candidatus Neomarinimicrobiota bacterium]MBT5269415.1 ROK family protein [Candidatus Neomarinimicrobiota bacterium]